MGVVADYGQCLQECQKVLLKLAKEAPNLCSASKRLSASAKFLWTAKQSDGADAVYQQALATYVKAKSFLAQLETLKWIQEDLASLRQIEHSLQNDSPETIARKLDNVQWDVKEAIRRTYENSMVAIEQPIQPPEDVKKAHQHLANEFARIKNLLGRTERTFSNIDCQRSGATQASSLKEPESSQRSEAEINDFLRNMKSSIRKIFLSKTH